jgi:hypothetical protein
MHHTKGYPKEKTKGAVLPNVTSKGKLRGTVLLVTPQSPKHIRCATVAALTIFMSSVLATGCPGCPGHPGRGGNDYKHILAIFDRKAAVGAPGREIGGTRAAGTR